jgi:hypothetical protein
MKRASDTIAKTNRRRGSGSSFRPAAPCGVFDGVDESRSDGADIR